MMQCAILFVFVLRLVCLCCLYLSWTIHCLAQDFFLFFFLSLIYCLFTIHDFRPLAQDRSQSCYKVLFKSKMYYSIAYVGSQLLRINMSDSANVISVYVVGGSFLVLLF